MEDTTASSQKQGPLIPEGQQPARCVAIIDIGTQKRSFNGVEKDPIGQVYFKFEFSKYTHSYKEGEPAKPLSIYQNFNWTADERGKLSIVLKAWAKYKKPLDTITVKFVKAFLGQYCSIYIEHNVSEKNKLTYANIGNKGKDIKPFDINVPKPSEGETPKFFNLKEFSWETFRGLPKFIQEDIRKSAEWPAIIKINPEPTQEVAGSTPVENEAAGVFTVRDENEPEF